MTKDKCYEIQKDIIGHVELVELTSLAEPGLIERLRIYDRGMIWHGTERPA